MSKHLYVLLRGSHGFRVDRDLNRTHGILINSVVKAFYPIRPLVKNQK
ncbi:MAG: hypothetical protein SWX82_05060 [Cyanobacteriota bacterium]|nr:hypothetical protein [Cyanobacteriota bacterium]